MTKSNGVPFTFSTYTKIFVIEYPEVDLHCLFAPIGDIDCNSVGVGDLIPTYEDGKITDYTD